MWKIAALVLLILIGVFVVPRMFSGSRAAAPVPGNIAPDFTLASQEDTAVSLKDYRGKWVILYFYPKDQTSGCTREAHNFQIDQAKYNERNAVILGVSVDSAKSHKKFEEKYELPFTLVSDEDKKIVEAYGVWGEKKMWGKPYMGTFRETFLIDEHGIIRKIIAKPDTANHTEEVLEAWKEA